MSGKNQGAVLMIQEMIQGPANFAERGLTAVHRGEHGIKRNPEKRLFTEPSRWSALRSTHRSGLNIPGGSGRETEAAHHPDTFHPAAPTHRVHGAGIVPKESIHGRRI